MIISHQKIGGQLLAAALNDSGLFYRSPLSLSEKTARAGVPICFPQFGTRGHLPKHGFARNHPWELMVDEPYKLVYQLEVQAGTWPDWPYHAKLEIAYQLLGDALQIVWTIQNVDTRPFSFTGALHPYFLVDNIASVQIKGLKGLACDHLYHPEEQLFNQEFLSFDNQPVESCFSGIPDLLMYENGEQKLHLKASGFTHWMIWNPGKEGAKDLLDLPNEDWQHFICIEPLLLEACDLAPTEKFTGMLAIKK